MIAKSKFSRGLQLEAFIMSMFCGTFPRLPTGARVKQGPGRKICLLGLEKKKKMKRQEGLKAVSKTSKIHPNVKECQCLGERAEKTP